MSAANSAIAPITTKAVGDRWRGATIGAGVVGLSLLGGMAAYREIDLGVYESLPEAFRSLIGIPQGVDVAGLAYGAIYGFYGALVLSSIALSMGAASIAGEERDGTAPVLFGVPRSRRQVLVAKAAAMLVLTGLGTLVLFVFGLLSPRLLDVEVSGMHLGAQAVHLFSIATFHGALALAIGGWTGRRSLASGATVAVMVLSFFAVGLLPLFASLADLARAFPWWYLDGGKPLVNGVQWGHVGLLVVGSAVLFGVGLVGLQRRDLRDRDGETTLLDRLRTHPLTQQAFERLAGSTRVSHLWIKTATEHQGIALVAGLSMFTVMGLAMGPMFAAMDESVLAFARDLPDFMVAIIGGGDMSTPQGFYQAETFSIMAPAAIMAVTVTIGARAVAGAEADRTMGVLLATGIRRSRIVLEAVASMVVLAVAVAVVTFAGVVGGSMLGGLGLDVGNVAATTVLVTLLGLFFGALALAVSAATGRVRAAVWSAVGAALGSYLVDSFLPFNDTLAGLANLSPFNWYLRSDPLNTGMHWGHAGLYLALTMALVLAAVWLFDRRDLRQH